MLTRRGVNFRGIEPAAGFEGLQIRLRQSEVVEPRRIELVIEIQFFTTNKRFDNKLLQVFFFLHFFFSIHRNQPIDIVTIFFFPLNYLKKKKNLLKRFEERKSSGFSLFREKQRNKHHWFNDFPSLSLSFWASERESFDHSLQTSIKSKKKKFLPLSLSQTFPAILCFYIFFPESEWVRGKIVLWLDGKSKSLIFFFFFGWS